MNVYYAFMTRKCAEKYTEHARKKKHINENYKMILVLCVRLILDSKQSRFRCKHDAKKKHHLNWMKFWENRTKKNANQIQKMLLKCNNDEENIAQCDPIPACIIAFIWHQFMGISIVFYFGLVTFSPNRYKNKCNKVIVKSTEVTFSLHKK